MLNKAFHLKKKMKNPASLKKQEIKIVFENLFLFLLVKLQFFSK